MALGVRGRASRIGRGSIAKAQDALSDIESRLADTPAEGIQGLVVKLGLHCFLNDHATQRACSPNSAYRDLVRLTGKDPAVEIADQVRKESGLAELIPVAAP